MFPAVLQISEPLGGIVGVGWCCGAGHLTPDPWNPQVVQVVRGGQVVVAQLVTHHVVLTGVPYCLKVGIFIFSQLYISLYGHALKFRNFRKYLNLRSNLKFRFKDSVMKI